MKTESNPTINPEEAQQLASLSESITLLRERRRKLTLTIAKLVERRKIISDRLRTRARRQEKADG